MQADRFTHHGLEISEMIRVESAKHVSECLRDASERGEAILPLGGGTSLDTGFVVDEAFTALDLSGIGGIVDYIPTDMTAGFLAGTTLREVRESLATNGQELPVAMPASDRATIGGLVATGFAGPRRLSAGTLKDLLIGCEYVRPDGLVAKAGGMTVKNVSGFEIPRLMNGSWGSLAVLTRVNLKVLPIPESDVTVLHRAGSLAEALDLQTRLLSERWPLAAMVTERQGDGWNTAMRFTGRQVVLDQQSAEIIHELTGETAIVAGPEPWRDHAETWAECGDDAVMVVGGSIERLRAMLEQTSIADVALEIAISLGTVSTTLRVDPGAIPADRITSELDRYSLSWVIEGGPVEWRRGAAIWGPQRADAALARSVKDQFDPAGVLNRGRLFV